MSPAGAVSLSAWRRALCASVWSAGWTLELLGRGLAHFAAGTLSLRDFRATLVESWEQYGRRDDDILSGLMPWEQDCYTRCLRPGDRILLVGCGTGRDLIALLRAGYRVEGLDPAAGAIAVARRMLDRLELSAPLHTGAVESFAIPGTFDVIVFSWFSYGYIPQSRTRVEVLRRLGRALPPGGRIIVSYVRTAAHAELPARITRLGGWLTRADWRAEPGDRVWVSAPRRRTLHYQHEFVDGEFEDEAAAAGLRIVSGTRGAEGVAVLEPAR